MKRRLLLQGAAASVALGHAALVRAQGSAPRLVSLSGGMTEVVYRLGAESLLVGTDTTSTYPAAALQTPKVGYMRQLSAEGVLALRPTALLATNEAGPARVLDQLKGAGLALHLVQADHSFEELRAKVRVVAQASGRVEAGKALEADLQTQWQAALRKVAQADQQRRSQGHAERKVLFVMAHGGRPQGAGTDTAAHAMMTFAGARNVLSGGSGYQALTAEAVAQAAPDIILTTQDSVDASGGLQRFWQFPGLAFTPAGRQQRVVALDAMALLGFGPRLPQTLDDLRQRLA
ncbi:ABC transporter substrate-binding protein [Aquabacterium soli]|uniref:ABC transporter substrate-binding protein n=1 Tax=Aquabacterium soli TaxID=2493092 RepID=A0A426VCF8_9BURK|nr:ABC transporter substrate-binding protein [Aquabacterium soli]RRS04561.1 ABC transporter substrate-binding protein [Aquabacterium soli]